MQHETDKKTCFESIVNTRRSVRVFDKNAPFDTKVVDWAIDQAVLAPNSNNLQLWEFYRIKSEAAKKEIARLCLGQPAASTANEMLVIVTRLDKWQDRQQAVIRQLEKQFPDIDSESRKRNGAFIYYEKIIPLLYSSRLGLLSDMMKKITVWFRGTKKPTPREVTQNDLRISVHRSAALAAQNFMLAIKAAGYDTCPMEGHDSKKILQYLKLPDTAEVNMVIGIGPGKAAGIYGPRFRVPKSEVVFEL